jgi:hypothetical protein
MVHASASATTGGKALAAPKTLTSATLTADLDHVWRTTRTSAKKAVVMQRNGNVKTTYALALLSVFAKLVTKESYAARTLTSAKITVERESACTVIVLIALTALIIFF